MVVVFIIFSFAPQCHTLLGSNKNIAPPAKVMAWQEAAAKGRNMSDNNVSLIAQLRECEDADNGPVLIKLCFSSPLSSFKQSLLKPNFLSTHTSNAHVSRSVSRLCSSPCTIHDCTSAAALLVFDLREIIKLPIVTALYVRYGCCSHMFNLCSGLEVTSELYSLPPFIFPMMILFSEHAYL